MAAVEAHFRFCGEDGSTYADEQALTALGQHFTIEKNRAGRVKTLAITPTAKQLFDIRKRNTHYFPLAIMEGAPSCPKALRSASSEVRAYLHLRLAGM